MARFVWGRTPSLRPGVDKPGEEEGEKKKKKKKLKPFLRTKRGLLSGRLLIGIVHKYVVSDNSGVLFELV